MQKVAPQSQNATSKRLRRFASRYQVWTSRFGDDTFPISLCVALFDALIGHYL